MNQQSDDRQPPVDAGEGVENLPEPGAAACPPPVDAGDPSCHEEASPSPDGAPSPANKSTSPNPTDPNATDVAAAVREELQRMQEAINQRIATLESAIENLTSRVSLMPPQVRQLTGKVEGLGTAIAEPRCRALLLGLVGIYDLLDPATRGGKISVEEMGPEDHRRNYQVLQTQIRQILDANGLSEIPTDGPFDPENHHAVNRISCGDPAEANQIVDIVRSGFRTPQAVLRFAEVVVTHFDPEQPTMDAASSEEVLPPPDSGATQ